MQDFSELADRVVARPGATALVVVLALLSVAVPAAGQPTDAGANGTGTTGAPSGEGQVVPCQQVKETPQGDPSAAYRIVRGSCSVSIENGEVLSRVWFNGDGGEISIDASGSGGLSGTSR